MNLQMFRHDCDNSSNERFSSISLSSSSSSIDSIENNDDEILIEDHDKYPVKIDNGLAKLLKPHQINGIKFMYNCTIDCISKLKCTKNDDQSVSGCILAHSMGLGKTLQVVTLIHTMFMNPVIKEFIKKVLIIVPYNVAQNWFDEFQKWQQKCINKNAISYVWKMFESKSSSKRQHMIMDWDFYGGVMIITSRLATNLIEKLIDADLVIVDEGHLLKNNKTAFYKALNMIKTRRRIVLTGTPLQNNLTEYFFMIDFIKPKLLGQLELFRIRFEIPINNGQLIDSTDDKIKLMKKRLHVLSKKVKNYVHRCDYEILVPYLPPKHEYVLSIRMTSLQTRLYQYYINNVTTITRKNLLNDARILMLINNHPFLLLDYYRERYNQENFNTHRDYWWRKVISQYEEDRIDDIGFSNKFTIVFFILEHCKIIDDKILIFSQSIATLNYLEQLLNMNDWIKDEDYFRIDGQVDIDKRHDVIERFNDQNNKRARLMLISIRAGGIGINLTAANRVIILDCSWNPAIDSQAIFRVFRLGQTKPVFIYRLVSYGTMEWKIYERQVQKQSLSKRVVDEQHVVRNYTRAELEEMYRFEESPEFIAIPEIPSDNLLADLLSTNSHSIFTYHEHDSLLALRPEEELNDYEKQEALAELESSHNNDHYRHPHRSSAVSKHQRKTNNNNNNNNSSFINDNNKKITVITLDD